MYGNTHRWLVRDADPEGLGGLDPLKICIGGVIVCFDPFYPVSEMTYTVSSGMLNSSIPYPFFIQNCFTSSMIKDPKPKVKTNFSKHRDC